MNSLELKSKQVVESEVRKLREWVFHKLDEKFDIVGEKVDDATQSID